MSAGAGKLAASFTARFPQGWRCGKRESGDWLLLGRPIAGAALPPMRAKDFAPNAYIEIHPNGEIRLIAARSEMGQGVRTSMTMILAEELDADWSKIKVEQAVATSEMKYGDMTTGGSESVRSSWDPLRKAGATGRDMLMTAAAQTWGVPVSECSAIGGSVDRAQEIFAAVGVRRACRKSCGVARSQRCAAERREGLPHHRYLQAAR